MVKKRGLGKGLGAILDSGNVETTISDNNTDKKTIGSVSDIEINKIEANPFQPRTEFEKEALIELVNSIKQHGLIQPITLRKMGYGKYQIISGERRFRASQIAGLEKIPAYIRVANDQAMLEMAIVENVQRQDLNAIEVALSFKRLLDECNLTQEELSEKVGKNRSTVTNFLRLLNLPDEIQIGLKTKKISMGHARALLGAKDEAKILDLYRKVIANELSVRKTEELVKEKTESKSINNKTNSSLSFDEQKVKDDLSFQFSAKVDIKKSNKGNGKIVIPFKNEEHFKRILGLLEK